MSSLMDFIALEADDITGEVENETNKALGKRSIKEKQPKRDIMETNDILGIKTKNSKNDIAEPLDDDTNDSLDLDNETDDITDDDDSLDDTYNTDDLNNTDDDTLDENDDENTEPEEAPVDEDYMKKVKLRENMILFYNIISANINVLSDYTPKYNTSETADVISKVSNNLIECKNNLYYMLTEEVQDLPYEELLRKYIALSRVYDLCIKMLETHFDNIELLHTNPKAKNQKSSEEK